MKLTEKIVITLALLLVAGVANELLAPASQLAANTVIVRQMDGSNASALAAHYVGSGDWVERLIVTVLLLAACGYVWTRKSTHP